MFQLTNSFTSLCPVIIHSKHFTVPPQINAFEFGEEPFNAGEGVDAQCSISKGDYPVNITWLLNGNRVPEGRGIAIVRVNRRMSTLSVDSVQAIHAGNYTCVATNRAGTVMHTAYLAVNGTAPLPGFCTLYIGLREMCVANQFFVKCFVHHPNISKF